jgi:hypothetical protein
MTALCQQLLPVGLVLGGASSVGRHRDSGYGEAILELLRSPSEGRIVSAVAGAR